MSTRHPVYQCPNCRKPFYKSDKRQQYCTFECRREASLFKERCKRAERNMDLRYPFPEEWARVPREKRPAAELRVARLPKPKAQKEKFVPVDLGPERRMKRRAQWQKVYETVVVEMNRRKLESGCVDCGYRGHPTALQFDHVRGEKIAVVSSFNNLKAALAEAEKCEVRCANCHSIRTWKWKQELRKERIARDLTLLAEIDK